MHATTSYGLVILCWSFMSLVITSMSLDTINVNGSIRDGQTIVSADGDFELGFFSPGSSEKRYVGIWFKKFPNKTVVWVANRERPLLGSSGILHVTNKSNLVLVDGNKTIIWSTNFSGSVQNPIAELQDTGNLVIRDQNNDNSDNFLWQSFDYPCDTHLPGMKLGRDLVTGLDRFLTSWKSEDDPSPGKYTYRMIDHQELPQLFLLEGSSKLFRDGPWTDIWFSDGGSMVAASLETYEYVSNQKEISFSYSLINPSLAMNRYLSSFGTLMITEWTKEQWTIYSFKPRDECDTYAVCGAFSICNITQAPLCYCMQGFVPKFLKDWAEGHWSDGCVPSSSFNCSSSSQFVTYSNIKLPDAQYSMPYAPAMDIDECRNMCLQNCSCVAYAIPVAKGGPDGCFLWFDTLIDMRFISNFGQAIYVRAIYWVPRSGGGQNHIGIAVGSSLLAVVVVCAAIFIVWTKKRLMKMEETRASEVECSIINNNTEESKSPTFPFNVIAQATNYFSHDNKLGEGGFGPVYKGVLSDGQEIAVKRLSKDSRQGLNEFKNEVLFIARLQHRNLVKLMGCCVESDERMLIYEYMPNKSLDFFIFDQNNTELDWPKRFEIINGIARGLLYLHQDSRLRIVHRDLKASNILLDLEMNPKISDFGMARSFLGNEDEARTKRVVGTYGYMPPEYAIDGVFSVKSDVFSFGVLMLEIVSGKRNRGFNHPDHHLNLLGHAWMLFSDGSTLDIVDPLIRSYRYASQMKKVIHIGLLCVQQHPLDRPSM